MKIKLSAVLVVGVLFLNTQLWAANLGLLPGSKIWIEGQSTLHPYSSQTVSFNTSMVLSNPQALSNDYQALIKQNHLNQLIVNIPVESLKSKEEELDKNLYKTLKSDLNPEIVFKLQTYQLGNSKDNQSIPVFAQGILKIAGKEKSITLNAVAKVTPQGLKITGVKKVLMTDYGVDPPVIMFVIRCENEITVNFDLRVGVKKN